MNPNLKVYNVDPLYCTVQLFPLLMVTYHEHGGYRMDSSEIGVVLMVVGVFQPLFQVRSMVILLQHVLAYEYTLRLRIWFPLSCSGSWAHPGSWARLQLPE